MNPVSGTQARVICEAFRNDVDLTMGIYLPIMPIVRRLPGHLLPLEAAICVCAAKLRSRGTTEFYGYEMAKRIGDESNRRLLTAYGTLYRALGRLETMGLLQSQWEDPHIPARENRPGRRLYALTAAGEAAAQEARKTAGEKAPKRAPRRPVPA
jgi:DNA-binding PadR family transcriptional regulator